jgi:RNA polymerase primary sigma factor
MMIAAVKAKSVVRKSKKPGLALERAGNGRKARAESLAGIGAGAAEPVRASAEVFRSVQLNKELGEFCQLFLYGEGDLGLGEQWRRLRGQPIDWIANDFFDHPDAELRILGEALLARWDGGSSLSKSHRLKDLPPHLARLCETRLLKPEEEAELFRRMNYLRHVAKRERDRLEVEGPSEAGVRRVRGLLQAADWHRDLIVRSNMRLVISIVKKFVNPHNLFDDLLSDGIMALIRAVEKFDYDRGFRFSTYATQVVRRNAYRNVMARQKERTKVTTSLEDGNFDFDDQETQGGISPDRWNLLRSKLTALLDKLDRREKLIVRARFSLGSHRRVQTLQRIADSLGVSKERVRQLEKRALEKLRELAISLELPEFVAE